jgi:hypothetical protein
MFMHLKFSQDLAALLTRAQTQPITLGDILAETAERGFTLVIGLLTLPFLFPMPPGFTGPLGSGSLLLAVQMMLGRRSPWLPRRIANFQIPDWLSRQLLTQMQRVSQVLEKLTRPRLRWLADSPQVWRLNGLCMAWLTILLILPIPFTNPIPTTGILLLAVATLEADGFLMCLGYGLTLAITAAMAGAIYALWQSSGWLLGVFGG